MDCVLILVRMRTDIVNQGRRDFECQRVVHPTITSTKVNNISHDRAASHYLDVM